MAKKRGKKARRKPASGAAKPIAGKASVKKTKPKKPAKSASLSSVDVAEGMSQAVPNEPVKQKPIAEILIAVLVALVTLMAFFWWQTNRAKQDEIQRTQGQDQLLQVIPSSPENIQPSGGESQPNLQTPLSPQPDGSSSQQLQPTGETSPQDAQAPGPTQ